MATISLLRSRIDHRPPPAPEPAPNQPARPLLDRWFLAWAEKAEARWVQPGYPHSRYY